MERAGVILGRNPREYSGMDASPTIATRTYSGIEGEEEPPGITTTPGTNAMKRPTPTTGTANLEGRLNRLSIKQTTNLLFPPTRGKGVVSRNGGILQDEPNLIKLIYIQQCTETIQSESKLILTHDGNDEIP